MPEPSDRSMELARSTTDGEGIGPEVVDRIARAIDRGREEGRNEILQYVAAQAESPDWRDDVRVALRYVVEGIKRGFSWTEAQGA